MRRSEYSNKTSVVGTLIASICILVYLGALVSVIVRVSASMDQRRAGAAREFHALADRASAAGAVSFMDELFVEIVQGALNESRVLEGVIISSPGGVFGFERERGHALAWVDGSPRFRSRFGFSRQELIMPLRIQGMWNVNIHAVAGVFDYAELAYTLRQAMVLIAAALAVAFFTLLVESSVHRKRRPAYADDSRAREAPEPSPREDSRESASAYDAWKEAEAEEKAERPKPSAHKPGNYSERGHVVRREHTEGRLAEEMERSAAAGQDLAFIAIEFKSPEADNYYTRLAADAARFFSSREFICERGERGLSIICPGLSLDMGFLNATEFHNRALVKYPSVFKQKTDLCMGISACSERDVNAARIIFEAEEALERALMDPVSHVIAFKSDPDKYRAFMEGRRSGQSEG
ncbi:MAG: hypothetical protein FWB79_05145 [Treponema sp.]|nr:hypothetical protein [Treponema sp.]